MKDLKFICAQPDDTYYTWQVHLWLESLKNIGHSDKAIVLIFTPASRPFNDKWKKIQDLYPEAEFKFYKDEEKDNPQGVSRLVGVYIPVLRPWLLWNYFKENPQMSQNAVFYCDSDILFTEKFDVDEFKDDTICYVSNTNSYVNSDYFDSKVNQVLPEKLEEYKNRDILGELASVIGISREIAEKNKEHSGGAQYFLKNITASFWSKVMNDCIIIRTYLQAVNQEFFKDENTGFQSWCADMWAVLWNLWLLDHEVKVVPELDFAWGSDPITKLDKCTIYHNAGIVSGHQQERPCFYKGKYHSGADPTKDPHLDVVLNDDKSKELCTWYYANALNNIKQKYNLNY